jgi:hypothetical protein
MPSRNRILTMEAEVPLWGLNLLSFISFLLYPSTDPIPVLLILDLIHQLD